jgi:2-polyprenyl-6-methoxyphenol hydroxylase-like FAD-dependent oxidoreductase
LDPGALRLGANCTSCRQDEQGVTVHFADGGEERGSLAIGADGLRSTLRAQILGEQSPRYSGYLAWRGVTRLPDLVPPGVACESWGCGSRFGVVPLGQERVYWFATVNAPPGSYDPAGGRKQEVLERFQEWHKPIEAIVAATDEAAILRHDIFDRPLCTVGAKGGSRSWATPPIR